MPDYMVDPQERPIGPPNMAAQLFGMISSLPDAYQQGVQQKFARGQMARTEKLQEPVNLEDGKLDYSALVQKYLQAKGTEAIPDVLPNAWKTQFLQNEKPTPSPYGPPQGQTSGASIHGQPSDVLHEAAGEPPREGSEAPVGQFTINDLATRAGGLKDPKVAATNIAKVVGVNPGARLTAEQEDKVRKILAPYMGQGDETGTTGAPAGGQGTPSASAPAMQGATPVQMAQAGPGQASSSAAGMVPPGADPRAYAQGLKQAAERERTAARREGIAGIPSKAREDKAAAYDKTADDILKAISEEGKQRTQQGLDIAKSDAEKDRDVARKRAEETMTQVDSANTKAIEGNERTRMMHSLTNQPDFNAGVGAHYIDILNGIGNRLFGLPNLGTSGQFFDKLRAGSILNEIKGLGGSGAGPVRVTEMKFIDTMQAGRNMNPTSIRSALVTEDRLHQRAQEIFEMKKDYLKTHRELDQGFTDKMADYSEKHHLFSDQEMAHPDLVGMPILRSEAQLKAAQLPRGTPYRTGYGPDAKIKFAPEPSITVTPTGDKS